MRSISDTITRLKKLRGLTPSPLPENNRLADLGLFGPNPGALEAKVYVPKGLRPRSALVVVLHGCTQTALSYDHGSGWSQLAAEYGFAVLFPQQTRANNPNGCFNWFVPADIQADQGEAASIVQMIETVAARHDIDRTRIYVTGLSAGGAMANVMLATHPDLFAGGAIIAGLAYGTAATVPEAFDRMRGHGLPAAPALQSLLQNASSHSGPWPTISVWHGTKDATVVAANALSIIEQWRGVHGVAARPDTVDSVDGHTRQLWKTSDGQDVIENFIIAGMGHGTPLDPSSGYGRTAPYMLDAGISSTVHIARSWGLIASFEKRTDVELDVPIQSGSNPPPSPASPPPQTLGIQKTIEDALRAAGLMK